MKRKYAEELTRLRRNPKAEKFFEFKKVNGAIRNAADRGEDEVIISQGSDPKDHVTLRYTPFASALEKALASEKYWWDWVPTEGKNGKYERLMIRWNTAGAYTATDFAQRGLFDDPLLTPTEEDLKTLHSPPSLPGASIEGAEVVAGDNVVPLTRSQPQASHEASSPPEDSRA